MTSVTRHYWVAIALLLAVIPLPSRMASQRQTPLERSLKDVAYAFGEWQGRDQDINERVRRLLGTDDLLVREYTDAGGHRVGLYVSYFPRQVRGEISHSPKNCLPGAGWQVSESRRVRYPIANGTQASVNEIVFEKAGERQLVYYWFRERHRIVASEYLAKWYLMWDALTRDRTHGALLRIAAPIQESEEATRARCLAFMRLALPHLEEFLPG